MPNRKADSIVPVQVPLSTSSMAPAMMAKMRTIVPGPPKRRTSAPVKALERNVPMKLNVTARLKSRSLRPVMAASSGA